MMPDEYYVVFTDQTDLWWLKFLRHGFRHCFVLIRMADIWLSVDALAHKTEIMRIDMPDTFNMIKWLEGQGDIVVNIKPQTTQQKPLGPALFSCVEHVKRLIGIRAAGVITPWQLYNYLSKEIERKNYGQHHLTS
jgi:hypothetical protein